MDKLPLVRAALAAAMLLAACGQISNAGPESVPESVLPSQPGATPAASTDLLAARAVQESCSKQVPAPIIAVMPGAAATYVAHYALGSNCQWHTNDFSHRIIAYAITAIPYRNWQGLQEQFTDHITVAGYAAVRGHSHGSCVILVNVQNVAMEVDLTGIADPNCQTTTSLAEHILVAAN